MVPIAIRFDTLGLLKYHWYISMVSGHYDEMVSEYASKNLMKEVDVQVSAVIAKNPNILGDDTV